MSQRLFSTLFAFGLLILAFVLAAVQHVLPPVTDLAGNVFTLITPVVGVLINLNSYLGVIDMKVADGSLTAGDIGGLVTTPEFWTTQVAIFFGAALAFGVKVIDPQQQALLVNGLLAFSWIVLRSFTNRAPQGDIIKAQVVSGSGTTTVNVS